MRLTDRTDYALRVLMVLASSGQRHTVPALAEAFGVSANHLTKVVQALQGLGLVQTSAGRNGGVELAAQPSAVTVGEIVRALEPDLHLVECLREHSTCPLDGPCRLVGVVRNAQAAFLAELDKATLADLIQGRQRRLLRAVPSAVSVQGSAI